MRVIWSARYGCSLIITMGIGLTGAWVSHRQIGGRRSSRRPARTRLRLNAAIGLAGSFTSTSWRRDPVLCENSAEAGSLDEEPYSTQFQEACASELDPEPMAYDRDIRRVLRDASLSGTLAP